MHYQTRFLADAVVVIGGETMYLRARIERILSRLERASGHVWTHQLDVDVAPMDFGSPGDESLSRFSVRDVGSVGITTRLDGVQAGRGKCLDARQHVTASLLGALSVSEPRTNDEWRSWAFRAARAATDSLRGAA